MKLHTAHIVQWTKKILGRAWFWVQLPFVRFFFYQRERRRNFVRYPRLWLSTMQIVDRDLDLSDEVGSDKLDADLLKLLLDRRDKIIELVNRFSIISMTIFGFLILNYFRLSSDISLVGVSIKNSAGISEFLIVVAGTSGLYVSSLRANVAVVEATIMHICKRIYPENISAIMRAGLIPDQSFGKYYPQNLPHLNFTPGHSRFSQCVTYLYLACILVVMFAVFLVNFLILKDIWIVASIGVYSKLVSFYVLVVSLVAFAILVMTKLPMPYKDYSLLHEIEITRQIRPKNLDSLFQKIYRESNDDREDLRRRGFLEPIKGDPEN